MRSHGRARRCSVHTAHGLGRRVHTWQAARASTTMGQHCTSSTRPPGPPGRRLSASSWLSATWGGVRGMNARVAGGDADAAPPRPPRRAQAPARRVRAQVHAIHSTARTAARLDWYWSSRWWIGLDPKGACRRAGHGQIKGRRVKRACTGGGGGGSRSRSRRRAARKPIASRKRRGRRALSLPARASSQTASAAR